MPIHFFEIDLETTEGTDILDITGLVQDRVLQSAISNGSMVAFISGSTAALTTIEYEPGVVNDLRRAIDRIAPRDIGYEHDRRWGDGNGYAHVRASLLGPSLVVPVRRVLVQVMGE